VGFVVVCGIDIVIVTIVAGDVGSGWRRRRGRGAAEGVEEDLFRVSYRSCRACLVPPVLMEPGVTVRTTMAR